MTLSWTWYFPGMRNIEELMDAYQEKDFKLLRRAGVRFWDTTHKRWCSFPDGFREDLYRQGVLQDDTPPPKPKPLPLLAPQQGELF